MRSDEPDLRAARLAEAADLRHQHDERDLTDVGRFAGRAVFASEQMNRIRDFLDR
jgi:hypothetical protein